MKHYNLSQASRELGISKQKLMKMIEQKELKAEKKNKRYRIASSEIKRLAKKQDQEEEKQNEPQSNYLTITQAAKELGIERKAILKVVRAKIIPSIRAEDQTSPYRIEKAYLPQLYQAVMEQMQGTGQDAKAKPKEPKPNFPDRYNKDLLEIHKSISETMRLVSSTQQKIAEVFEQLMKKI